MALAGYGLFSISFIGLQSSHNDYLQNYPQSNNRRARTQWSSESHKEIMKLWEEEKAEQDKFSKIDMELVPCKDDKVIDDHEIIDAQREWMVIDQSTTRLIIKNENPISTMNTTLEVALLFGWVNHGLIAIGDFA